MNQCPYCGNKLSDYTQGYCPNCRKPLPEFNVSVRFDQDVTDSKVVVGGIVNITEEGTGECPDCFGLGIEHMECPRCYGAGQLKYYSGPKNDYEPDNILGQIFLELKRNMDASQETNYSYMTCEKCTGKGRIPLEDPSDLRSFMEAYVSNKPTGRTIRNPCPKCKGTKRVRITN